MPASWHRRVFISHCTEHKEHDTHKNSIDRVSLNFSGVFLADLIPQVNVSLVGS